MSAPPRLSEIGREKALWGLVVAGVAFFHRPLFFAEVFYYRDIFYYNVSQVALASDFLRSGQWPLWNPYHHGGMPFWADITNNVLYPANLLGLVFEPYRAITFAIVLHVIAAAAATYVLARRLALGRPAAFLAGTVFAYCGFTLAQASTPGRLMSLVYIPLMALTWHGFLEEGRPRWFFATAACGLLQVLTGAPPINALTFVTLLGWSLWGVESRWGPIRRVALFTLLGLTVAVLAAAQLVPLFELARLSSRGQGVSYEDFSGWSADPRRLPELVLPGFLGRDTLELDDYWGQRIVDGSFPYVTSFYFGPLVLALALAGGLGGGAARRPGPRRLLLALAALGIVASMGRFLPGFETLYDLLPPIRIFRYPSKVLVLAVLPVALLAAMGAERLFCGGRRPRLALAAWPFAALGGAGWLLLAVSPVAAERAQLFFFEQAGPAITRGLQAAAAHPLAFFVLAALVLQSTPRWGAAKARWAIAMLVTADLMLWGRQINPRAPLELLETVPPAAAKVGEVLSEGRQSEGRLYRERTPYPPFTAPPTKDVIWRHLWLRDVLGSYQGAKYRLPVVFHEDYDGLAPERVNNLAYLVYQLPWARRLPLLSTASVSAFISNERLELPGVEFVAAIENPSAATFYLYRNARAAERATLVRRWRAVATPQEAVQGMLRPDFDARHRAMVEGEVPDPPPAGCAAPRLEIETDGTQRREYRVETACPGILVLSEVFYPGWRVRVDGEDVPLLRVNYAWSGVYLEAGEHRVEWRFAPRSVVLGATVSGLAVAVLAVAAWARWRTRRKRDKPPA